VPSETDLLNDALGQIGAPRIGAISDGSINANFCLTFYPALRDSLLRMHHWNFATGRAHLSASVTPPLFEFSLAYPLPSDFLKMREYNGAPINPTGLTLWEGQWAQRYTIEGQELLTNDTDVYIVYTKRVTDPNIWDALFYQVCAGWLASKLANAIPKDAKKSAELLRGAMGLMLPAALAADGQEGTVLPFVSDSLTRGR